MSSRRRKNSPNYYQWYQENGYNDVARQIREEHRAKGYGCNKHLAGKPKNFVNDKRSYYRNEYLKSDHWKELRAENDKFVKDLLDSLNKKE